MSASLFQERCGKCHLPILRSFFDDFRYEHIHTLCQQCHAKKGVAEVMEAHGETVIEGGVTTVKARAR